MQIPFFNCNFNAKILLFYTLICEQFIGYIIIHLVPDGYHYWPNTRYYNLAHAVNERVVRQPSILRAGILRDYQLVGFYG